MLLQLLVILVLPACAHGASVSAVIDLTAPTSPFTHNWKRCIGSGHMLLGTRSDWRRHLALATNELGVTGIRGHGLLDDDMSVLPSKGAPPEFYNVDQVMDFLVSLAVKPVVELSFMPSALVSCGGSDQPSCQYSFGDPGSYKGLNMPPDNFGDWYDLVKQLAEHLVSRYGEDEVASWHFEVWNEMWGVPFPDPYMSLYNASALALKHVSPRLRVGGPATMQTQFVGEFIAATSSARLPVDFVSTHFYPTDPQCQTNQTKSNIDCFADEVLAAQKLAAAADLPFFITEYNDGLGDTSRDDASAAGFVFRMVGKMQPLDMFSWWTFSDVFEEGWMRSAPFHNGYGLMTMQGTRKPAWRAFEMLAGAGTERVRVTGVKNGSSLSVLATDGGGGPLGLQLFVANWHRVDAQRFSCVSSKKICAVDPTGSFTDQALCNADCGSPTSEAVRTLSFEVTLSIKHGSSTAPSEAAVYRIDSEHANPQVLWASWGSPQYITKSQEAQLDEASRVVMETAELVPGGPGESLVALQLEEYCAVRVII
eukprot:TRINITY_DN20653_c0_g1_i1.p1 TRINITY_DN20653_c0_g1~~TRINITY_DN20653_c0_g1_i1.p1  ORF type:complete len:537 (+),score=113.23 TRINITY_DN20653_c0_g1_i1:211-1821(+)